ncbi:MAG: GNAT family protein [Desulfovibrionaceae bacterium]
MSDVFLQGKFASLRPPDIEADVLSGSWHSWFNNKRVTKYLDQGVFPNTKESQTQFVNSIIGDSTRILLCIDDNESKTHTGVIQLHSIDLINGTGEITLVIGEQRYHPALPIESMALLIDHAFNRLNLRRISSGQLVDLWPWVNILEIIGFKIEGYARQCKTRNGRTIDGLFTSVLREDFQRLVEERGGDILPENIVTMISKKSRQPSCTDKIKLFFEDLYKDRF